MRAAYPIILLLAVAAAFGWWRWHAAGTPAAAPVAAVVPPQQQPAALRATAAAAKAAAAASGPAPAAAPQRADLVQRYALREEMRNTDLLAFVRKHLAEARAGDGEAQYAIAQILASCATLEKQTTADGRPVRDALGDATASERDRRQAQLIASHCDPLDDARAEVGTAADWYRQADRGGVGAAMLDEAQSGPDFGSAEARVDKLRRAVATGDPDVIVALVASDQQIRDTASRDPVYVAAAMGLTQCALGYDCSGTGPIYQSACPNGCPHADNVQNYFELNMNPPEFAAAQAYAATLAANIASGSDSWPQAQALEQGIAGAAADSP